MTAATLACADMVCEKPVREKKRKAKNSTQFDTVVIDKFMEKSAEALAVKTPATKNRRSIGRRLSTRNKVLNKKTTALTIAAAALLGMALTTPEVNARHYPLTIAPVPSMQGQDEQRVRVGIFDANGQRVLHAQVHGRTQLGPLPAGDYIVEVSSAAGLGSHKVQLGPGKRAVVRYSMEA